MAEHDAEVTIYVVRHAEKATTDESDRDPPLSELGMARAADLRDTLRGVDLAAVFATSYRRTQMTAGPTAGSAGLETTSYRAGRRGDGDPLPAREELLAAFDGRAVLVVGHSNTVPRIVEHLGGNGAFEVERDEFDNLIVLHVTDETTTVRRHRYGPVTDLGGLVVTGSVAGKGKDGRDNVSGVTLAAGGIVVCGDEGTAIQRWAQTADEQSWSARPALDLPADPLLVDELDLEGLASDEKHVYVVGSHSAVRRRARRGKPYKENRDRLGTVTRGGHDQRNRLFRVSIDESGMLRGGDVDALDLSSLLENDPMLGHATGVPSKENGVDIEGLAVDGEQLYLGLRGPVLRGNLTPIVRVHPSKKWKSVKDHRVLFVDLDGQGVRGLARCATGFLILTGPVGDAVGSARIVHWDGGDMLPGVRDENDEPLGRVTLLGTVPAHGHGTPEGLCIVDDTESAYEVLIVHDNGPQGAPHVYRLRKVPGL